MMKSPTGSRLLAAVAAVIGASSAAFAADVVWDANGGTGGLFTTAANWVGDAVPGAADVARITSNTSQANPVTLPAGRLEVDNVNLGASAASFLEVNGGTLVAFGYGVSDFSIGVGATQQSVFTLSSGTVEYGTPGVYTDGNDFDIGKNGNGRYVQTGGLFQQHADDVKIADSGAGVGLIDISGGQMFVADGFSVSDNFGGTGTLNIGGSAEVVSGNSGGRGGVSGTVASGYISVANGGGTGTLTITGNGALYGRYLEYRGSSGATASISVGGTGGKLVMSEEIVTGLAGSGSSQNVIGAQAGAPGTIRVREAGLFGVDNPTYVDFSDGYVIGRAGNGSLSVEGTNARVAVRQRLLVASGGIDMDFLTGDPGTSTPGSASMSVGPGGNVGVGELHIGVTGTGAFTQTGGSIAADNSSPLFGEAGFSDGLAGEDVVVGSLTGATGTYTHSGGSLTAKRDLVIGDFGTGAYTMSAGAVARVGGLRIGRNPGSSGTVTIDGGTLTASQVTVGGGGSGTFSVSGGALAGDPAVTVDAGGTMALSRSDRVRLAVGSLTVAEGVGGGRVDLGSGQVSVASDGISATDLRADILAGRNGGDWNGTTGITSSTAAATGGNRAVGYVVAADGSAKVSFAAPGDVDLTGAVDVFDLVSVNSAGKYGTGSAAVWSQGDFNYDGVTSVFDLVNVNTAGAYGQGTYFPVAPTAAGVGSVAAVPEPAALSIVLVAACLAGVVAGRRHR